MRKRINDEIPSDIFKNLIVELYKKYCSRVVVLVDEYDKPNLEVEEALYMNIIAEFT